MEDVAVLRCALNHAQEVQRSSAYHYGLQAQLPGGQVRIESEENSLRVHRISVADTMSRSNGRRWGEDSWYRNVHFCPLLGGTVWSREAILRAKNSCKWRYWSVDSSSIG